MHEALQAARLAQLEGALCALLRSAAHDFDVNDMPDGIVVHFNGDSIDIEYTRGGLPVGGEGV